MWTGAKDIPDRHSLVFDDERQRSGVAVQVGLDQSLVRPLGRVVTGSTAHPAGNSPNGGRVHPV